MAVTEKISKLVQNQFPDFYKEEGENFLLFIQAYYEYLEQNGKMTDAIRNLESYQDISRTTNDFIQYFINTFLPSVPLEISADKKLFTKYISSQNRARGSIGSYKLMFRALYNEDVEIEFPADQILKVSDGDWRKERYLVSPYNPATYNFIGKTIKGTESDAEALVEDIVRKNVRGRDIMQILLSNIKGTFNHLEPIRLLTDTGGTGHAPIVEAGINSATIISPGGEFQVGDVVDLISSNKGQFGQVVVTQTEDLGGTLTFSLVDGGSGYTISTSTGGTTIEFIGGDGSTPASFQIGESDVIDRFAISMNTNLVQSNNIFGSRGALVTYDDSSTGIMNTFANTLLCAVDFGFPENEQAVTNGVDFRDHANAVIVIANTSDPTISDGASLFGVTSGANATVNQIRRAYNSTNIVLGIDAYKNFSSGEKVNIATSDGTTVGTVSSFKANTAGIQPVSIGIITGRELSEGDIVRGRSSGTTGIVRHVGTTNGYYNSTLTIANSVDPQIAVGDILNGESSGANAVVQHIDVAYGSGTITLMVRNYTASTFTGSEKVKIVTYDNYSPYRANNETIGTVSSFSLGGRNLYTYRIGAVNNADNPTYQANLTSQFITGPMGRFIADEGIFDVSSNTTVGNVAYSTSNSSIENIYSRINEALNFESTTFGTIGSLSLPVGGSGYSRAPTIRVRENDIAALGIGEQYLTLQWDDENMSTGNSNIINVDSTDKIIGQTSGASGDVKGGLGVAQPNRQQHANGTYYAVARVWQDFGQRAPGGIQFANNETVTLKIYDTDYLPGTSDTRELKATGSAQIVSIQDEGILGQNAVITAGVGANGTITGLRVLDSGFCYNQSEVVIIEATNRNLATGGTARLSLSGDANSAGYYATSRGHLDSFRGYIQDSEFYQEFSYQVISPISLDRYRDYALELVHPAGQALFGKFRTQSNAAVDVVASANNRTHGMISGTVSIAKTAASGTIAITNNTTRVTGTTTDFLNEFDSKSVSGSVVVSSGNSTVIGTGTTFTNYESGDLLRVGGNKYTISTIANNTVMSVLWYSNIKGASSNSNYTINGANSFIVEYDPGDGIDNQFVEVKFTANSATNVVLDDKWIFGTVSSANVYYANSIIVSGSGTSFTTEFNDDDQIVFALGNNEFLTTKINSVRTDTELTLHKNWTLADLTGANCFSYSDI